VALGAILALGAMSVNWALQVIPVEPASAPTATLAPAASAGIPVAVPTGVPETSPSPRSHVVATGDTLIGLAGRYYGDESRWPEILDANLDRIEDPDNLRIGTELRIPDP
jgi:5'-nucleotidase